MRSRARKGISLFEAVAGLAVVGMVAGSALAATGREMSTAARARRAIEVEALATSRLDWLALTTERELQSLPDSIGRGTFEAPLDEYSWRTEVTPVAEQAGLYVVTVTVSWKDGSRSVASIGAKDPSYTLRSRIYRRPALVTAGGRGR